MYVIYSSLKGVGKDGGMKEGRRGKEKRAEGEKEREERKRGGEEEIERRGSGICVEESVASLLALSWRTDSSV